MQGEWVRWNGCRASGLAPGKRQQASAVQGLRLACAEGAGWESASTEPRVPGACTEDAELGLSAPWGFCGEGRVVLGGEVAFAEFGEGPEVFAFELVFDGGGAEVAWEDFPCVGFHFEVLAERWVGCEDVEGGDEVIGGGVEVVLRWGVEGDVEVDAPFFDAAAEGIAGEGDGEVAVAFEDTVFASGDDLVEVDVVGERLHEFERGGGRGEFEGGAEVEFADADAVFFEGR